MIGASAAVVGLVAGLGEFLGYALRFVSGYFSDKTKAYWFFTILGYGLLVSIPMLALTGIWQIAAILIIAERIGKALRNPARDTLISQAAKSLGTGFGFAIHEFLDQIGALIGPILLAFIFLSFGGATQSVADYQFAYSTLWIPFVLLMLVLFIAYFISKGSLNFEKTERKKETDKLSTIFWYYVIFTFLTTLGFINFVIFGYHFKVAGVLMDSEIPLFYGAAMIVDALFALMIGKMYDVVKIKKKNAVSGLLLLITIPLMTATIPFLALLQNIYLIFLGVLLWGAVMGSHETIMRAAIADITPLAKRGTGYGIFTAVYGFAALFGGIAAGFLYDLSLSALTGFVLITQVCAVLMFLLMRRKIESHAK
jgi:MFS family permease